MTTAAANPMTTAVQARVGTWSIDPVHSIVEVSAKHMVVSTVKGLFHSLEGTLHWDEADPAASSVEASIDVASIDTGEAQRDAHLRSDDFLNAEKYPAITFRSTRVEPVDNTRWKVHGDLTIRDVTREVVLDTEYEGQVKDVWGKQRAAFTAETTIDRKAFGVKWDGLVEMGSVVVGDKLRITLNIAAVRQE